MYVKTSWAALNENRKIFLLAFLGSLAVFSFLMNIVSLQGIIFYHELLVPQTLGADAVIFLVIFSFLLSLAIVLQKYQIGKSRGGKTAGAAGVFASLLTSGCAICPPLLLSQMGVPAAAAIFPLGGWEMRILSVGFLLLSIRLALHGIERAGACKTESIK